MKRTFEFAAVSLTGPSAVGFAGVRANDSVCATRFAAFGLLAVNALPVWGNGDSPPGSLP